MGQSVGYIKSVNLTIIPACGGARQGRGRCEQASKNINMFFRKCHSTATVEFSSDPTENTRMVDTDALTTRKTIQRFKFNSKIFFLNLDLFLVPKILCDPG
ncbi:hypothetical protein ILYODFUR_015483 [Ilyodon furcidens]|uniref:Uncharacterized protein n=1 Tax=Ilyodon furcidens TaxID=33524 RepID=A0ABV0VFT4_9TELE